MGHHEDFFLMRNVHQQRLKITAENWLDQINPELRSTLEKNVKLLFTLVPEKQKSRRQ